MEIFDGIRQRTDALLTGLPKRAFPYDPKKAAAEGGVNDLILGREAAFELGAANYDAVNYTVITNSEDAVPRDEIVLYGADIGELRGDCSFARITYMRTDDIARHGDEAAHAIIRNAELKKFGAAPRGYMMRASALSNREQVRVSKKAVAGGLSFEAVGDLLISKYKENRHVAAVRIAFITLPDAPYRELDALATQSEQLTAALNHVIADLDVDCISCRWKTVCDEVDGMKEMHKRIAGNTGRSIKEE